MSLRLRGPFRPPRARPVEPRKFRQMFRRIFRLFVRTGPGPPRYIPGAPG
jgi:hypothetical protein